ncbi:MAG: trypsin-like serine protease, partial [Polyangiaceae bacterium]|nr:trypsin-like serine protease [Polyangiaceae bacterium]
MRFASFYRPLRAWTESGSILTLHGGKPVCRWHVGFWWFLLLVLAAIVVGGCGSREDADVGSVSTQEDQLHRGINASVLDLQGVVAILNNGGLTCTGSLIAPQIVLTAAHCVGSALISGCSPTRGYSNISVRIPDPDGDLLNPDNSQIIGVDGIAVHPLYRKVCWGTRLHANCDPDALKKLGPYCNVIRECWNDGAKGFGVHDEHDLALFHLVSAPIGVSPIPVIV